MTDREGDTQRQEDTLCSGKNQHWKNTSSPQSHLHNLHCRSQTSRLRTNPDMGVDTGRPLQGQVRVSMSTEVGGHSLIADCLRSPRNRIRMLTNTDVGRGSASESRKGGSHSPTNSTTGGHITTHKTTEAPVSTQCALPPWGPETTHPPHYSLFRQLLLTSSSSGS